MRRQAAIGVRKQTEPYTISIDSFAKLVKEYIDRKGKNHHIVFLVDEIGQYIGNDSKLMLNLQTVTEDLRNNLPRPSVGCCNQPAGY